VIRKEKTEVEEKQNYVIAIPVPPKSSDPEDAWKKALAAHGIITDGRK